MFVKLVVVVCGCISLHASTVRFAAESYAGCFLIPPLRIMVAIVCYHMLSLQPCCCTAAGRVAVAVQLRSMDAEVISISRLLAVRTLQLEMEYIYNSLEEEALDVSADELRNSAKGKESALCFIKQAPGFLWVLHQEQKRLLHVSTACSPGYGDISSQAVPCLRCVSKDSLPQS